MIECWCKWYESQGGVAQEPNATTVPGVNGGLMRGLYIAVVPLGKRRMKSVPLVGPIQIFLLSVWTFTCELRRRGVRTGLLVPAIGALCLRRACSFPRPD